MVKKRVHELAKELNIENKEVMQKLLSLGVPVKSVLSAVDEPEIKLLFAEIKAEKDREKGKAAPAKEPAKKQAKPAAPAALREPAPAPAPAAASVQAKPAAPADFARPDEAPEKSAGRPGQRPEQPGRKAAEKMPAAEVSRSKERPPDRGFDPGPGLVDRVPSRPPDRRFLERPFTKGDFFPPPPVKAPGAAPGAVAPGTPSIASVRPAEVKPAEPERVDQKKPVEQKPPELKTAAPGTPPAPGPGPAGVRPPEARGEARPEARPERRGEARPETRRDAYPRTKAPAGAKPAGRPGEGRLKGEAPARKPVGARPPADRGPAPRGPVPGKKGLPEKEKLLKVPKVPEEVKPPEKLRRERGRPPERVREWRDVEDNLAERKLRPIPGGKRRREEARPKHAVPAPAEKKPLVIGETVTVQDLAAKMKISPAAVIKKLMTLGVLATINQEIDNETAAIVAGEFGFEVQVKFELDQEALLSQEPEENPAWLKPRPCVVTVMGHVDHGKTSLLDAIRETNVTATEVGGITQHIGAYQVEHNNKKITFIDTPGHEAFTAMRARGASVTDIAVLVVAADDGVMPQTVEAINHAKAAGTPIIVAINKIDKPEADPDRVKRQLTEYELVPEEWGGQTVCVPVSAKTRQGLGDLLEMILLVSEISDLKANPDRPARGTIIEAELDKGRGPVATVLVQNGTLRVGDNVLAGTAAGRVRAMTDHLGRRVKSAGPSTPVEVLGFSDVPQAGDLLYAVAEEKLARQIAAKRILRRREEEIKAVAPKISLDDLFKQIKEGQVKELNLILKADVQGSLEALKKALEGLSTDEVRVSIIHGGVGLVNETDILLASASSAIILGFNVKTDVNARRAAEAEKVDIRTYRVIYDAINDVKAAMSGLLEPEYRETTVGQAEVRKIFKVSRVGTIAGCYVKEGKLARDAKIKVIRDGKLVYEGKLDSLKRFKDDVREVAEGYECGLAVENFNDLREGDLIEAITTETIRRELA